MRYIYYILFILACSGSAVAQYAPQQGLPGSTAIGAYSSLFVRWATGCTIQRGLQCIDSPALGYASYGDSSMALGMPDHSVVSLGDSGVADLTFAGLIYNGPGPDFAVFENGFVNPANDSQAFLELAFVEVSSDGINYVRFPAQSLTQTTNQIAGTGEYMYANLLNNLAGKYGSSHGTPFDLQELAGTSGLDVNSITHVRLVDVIGDIHNHSSHDSSGRIINDPYPTNFPTSGFDLDAVGVINHISLAGIKSLSNSITLNTYPNPVSSILHIDLTGEVVGISAYITSVTGAIVEQLPSLNVHNELNIEQYPSGMYYLTVLDANGIKWVEKIIKY